ncbi:uncharacterized protein LOC121387848 [Gigantopelta aegis]|uniref:uncharacterized protein LOC121387848 n=1 Tax=Gigantopelta aegis TaxID=1735272 RepID=UPI001B88CC67|nr:uncharacterized protein LOC121387848 [Gigantopelta aegis]
MILELVIILQFIVLGVVSIVFLIYWRNRQGSTIPLEAPSYDNTDTCQHESAIQHDVSSEEATGKEKVSPAGSTFELRKRKGNIDTAGNNDPLSPKGNIDTAGKDDSLSRNGNIDTAGNDDPLSRKGNIDTEGSDDSPSGDCRVKATDGSLPKDEMKDEMVLCPTSDQQNVDTLKDERSTNIFTAASRHLTDGMNAGDDLDGEVLGGSESDESKQMQNMVASPSEEETAFKIDGDGVNVSICGVNTGTDLLQPDKDVQVLSGQSQRSSVADDTEAERRDLDTNKEKVEQPIKELDIQTKGKFSGIDPRTICSVDIVEEGAECYSTSVKQNEDCNVPSESSFPSGDSKPVHRDHDVCAGDAGDAGQVYMITEQDTVQEVNNTQKLVQFESAENQPGLMSFGGLNFGGNAVALGDTGMQPDMRSIKQPKATSDRFTNMKRTASDQIREVKPDIYVPTRACMLAEEVLLNFGVVVLIGSPGSGKTTIGLSLMGRIVDLQKRQPLVLTHHSQFEDIVTPKDAVNVKREQKLVVLLDDIYGKSNLVTEFQRSWETKFDKVWSLVQSGFIKLIITFRTQTFLDCEESLNAYAAFSKVHQIDLHGPGLCLTNDEKLNILKRHLKHAWIPMSDEDEETAVNHTFTELGFPQCCRFYVNSLEAQKRGVEFFKRPIEYLKDHFNKLKSDRSEQCQYQYLVLLIVMFKQGMLTYDSLDPFEDQTETIYLRDKLKHVCKINCDVSLGQIKSSANSLCGLYLERNDKTRAYSFIHQSVFDTLFLQFSSEYPKQGIKICSVTMLLQYITTPGVPKKGDVVMVVNENNYSVLAQRFTDLLKTSRARSILSHQSFKDEQFVEYLINKFWKSVVPTDILSQKLDHHDHVTEVVFNELNLSNMWRDAEKQNGYFPDFKAHESVTVQQTFIFSSTTVSCVAVTEGLHTLSTYFVNGICQLQDGVAERKQEVFNASCLMGNTEIINLLLNSGVIPTMAAFTAVAASSLDDSPMFEKLLTFNTNVELSIQDLESMLAVALEKGNGNIANLLIDKISKMDSSHPILERALKQLLLQCHGGWRHSDLCRYRYHKFPTSVTVGAEGLFKQSSKYISGMNPRLCVFLAAAFDDVGILKEIINTDSTCLSVLSGNETLLHTASRYGCPDSVKYLIDLGLQINDTNIKKKTALHLAAEHNASNVVECLLLEGADPNSLDEDENTPLHLASRANSLQSAIKLVEMGSKVNMVNEAGDSPLHIACKCNSLAFIKYLVEEESKVDLKNNKGMTPFHMAVHYNKADVIQYLVLCRSDLKGPCPISYESFNRYPLPGCFDVAQFLFNKRVDQASDLFAILLHRATRVGNIMSIRFLLEKGVKPDTLDMEGKSPLHSALRLGDGPVIKLLLKYKASVNISDKNMQTPLHDACLFADSLTVKVLLDHGAKTELKNKRGLTPLQYAGMSCDKKKLWILLKGGADINSQDNGGFTVLYRAALNGFIDAAEVLISLKADVNRPDRNGQTAVMNASLCGREALVKLLVAAGADINKQDNSQQTSLHLAAITGQTNTIPLMLHFKADPYLLDCNGLTCMHHAATFQRHDALRVLLDNGMDPNCVDANNQTPIFKACSLGQEQNIRLLLERGASLAWKDKTGETPLHPATVCGQVRLIKLLLEAGADIDSEDNKNNTPLIIASSLGKLERVNILLENGANPNHGDGEITAIHVAAGLHFPDILQHLLDKGGSTNVVSSLGNTPLHSAVRKSLQRDTGRMFCPTDPKLLSLMQSLSALSSDVSSLSNEAVTGSHTTGNVCFIKNPLSDWIPSLRSISVPPSDNKPATTNVVDMLLQNGCCINAHNNAGQTALHVCVEYDQLENLQMLLERGADIAAVDKEGNSVLHEAVARAQVTTVEMLLNAGSVDVPNIDGKTACDLANSKIASADDLVASAAAGYAAAAADDDDMMMKYVQIISLLS